MLRSIATWPVCKDGVFLELQLGSQRLFPKHKPYPCRPLCLSGFSFICTLLHILPIEKFSSFLHNVSYKGLGLYTLKDVTAMCHSFRMKPYVTAQDKEICLQIRAVCSGWSGRELRLETVGLTPSIFGCVLARPLIQGVNITQEQDVSDHDGSSLVGNTDYLTF